MDLVFAPSQIETWPLDRLRPYARNAKIHGTDQVAKIAASMAKFGWTVPCLVADDGELIAGHGRVLAAIMLGLTEVPVIRLGHLDEAERRAYRIADNKLTELGEWDEAMLRDEIAGLLAEDFDLSLLGITDEDLDALLRDPDQTEGGAVEGEDDVPEPPVTPVSVAGDLWQLGSHRLICGDSTSADVVGRLLGDVRPLLMVTDPPYGVEYDPSWRNQAGAAKTKRTGKVLNDDRADWREAWALFPGDVAYVWHGALHAATVAESLVAAGFAVRSQIIWAKDRLVLSRGDYHWQHEPCWYAVRKTGKGHWAGDRKQTTLALPNTSSELAILAGTQTFTGNKTFSGSLTASGAVSITGTLTASGTVTVSAAAASIGTAITAATYGMGTGVNPTGVTKTLNLGTGGASGSTTVVNIGSATAGAGGTTVVNTPTVTFANAVTQVGMPQANLTAQLLGLGGATADSFNRLSMNTPAVLLNNAGAGIEATVNKAAAGNDAAFAFKTGFSARALIGLLGNDNFSFKVSPNGSTFFDAILVDRASGQVELPQPTVLPGLNAAPAPPPSGKTSVYARNRAGAPWIDVMRPSGRDFPLQPHFGVNRIANWSPSITTTITTEGLPITNVGTVSHPTLAATNLAASMRRWRLTSAAVVDSVAEQRSAGWACWRGNAAGLGGWTFVTRLSLTTLQGTGMGFFGLYGSIAALATTLTLAAVINAVGIGFQRGTHANWQMVTNDGTGAPTLTDMGAPFAVALGGVLTLFIAAPPNGSSVWVRAVNEVTGAVFEQEVTADLPANTQFLSPRLYLNTGATAAAVAYDCAGLYLETDY